MRDTQHRPGRIAQVCMGTAMLGAPCIVFGQQADAQQLDRVVITAEKRLTLLDDTPASVTALSGSKLTEQGLNTLSDVATLAPNVSFTGQGQGVAQIFVRGIGNVFLLAGGDPGVALYADGAYVSDQTSSNVSLFDLARVEVLRGPQGALYGRNATGGAVNLISARPTDAFSAHAGVLVGNYGRKESEGYVSGPLGDSGTSARLSYQVQRLDGWTSNPLNGTISGPVIPPGPDTTAPGKLDDLDSRALRLQTSSNFGNAGTLRVIAGHYLENENGPSVPVLVDPVMISQLLFGVTPPTDPRVVKSQGSFQKIEVNHVLVNHEMPIGSNTLSILLSWRGSRVDHSFDADDTESPTANTHFTTGSTDKSIDVHLSSDDSARLQWMVGATALSFRQQQDVRVSAMVPAGFLQPGAPLNVPVPVDFLLGGTVHTRSTAVYTDLRYAITPQLAVLGGLRYNRDRKESDEYLNVATFGLAGTQTLSDSWTSTPGSVGVEYRLSPRTLTYARLSHGFKSGAVNLGALQPNMVKPETVSAFEVGLKSEFLQRKGLFSAALFTSRYKDMQVSQVGQATVQLTNASSARIDGAEFELALRPVSPLTLNATLGLMDPRYTDFTNVDLRHPSPPVNVKGNQLAQVSKAQASVGAEYAFGAGSYRGTVRADWVWRDTVYFTEFNTEDARQGPYGMLHLAATLRPADGRWKLYGYVKNATNTTAITSMSIASPVLGSGRQVTYTPPRMYGIGATLDF
jgi:outer membrane receptor protein involved in Fe transport